MAEQRPNIVLITADQWRGDFLSIAGHPVMKTPNLDSWVNQGAYFPKAYSEVPSTTAAHRMILSGKGNYDCGLVGYTTAFWEEPNTVAQAFADAGYHCIDVGTRNVHFVRQLYGFHTVYTANGRAEGESDYHEWLKEEFGPQAHPFSHGVDANGWLARPFHLQERYHQTNWAIDTTLRELKRRDPTRPFFVWISIRAPHSPYDPPKHFWDMYINEDLPEPVVGDWADIHDVPIAHPDRTAWHGRLPEDFVHPERAGYMGCCTHIDFQIGHLMERLAHAEMGRVLNNTLMLFHSDHGDMLGDHHLHRKTYAYEGSARIPFFIRYPADMDAPTGQFDHIVGIQDIMPTLLDAAGVQIPESVTGTSVFKALNGRESREYIHGEHSTCYDSGEAMQYLTDGKHKYIWFPLDDREQFFDLENDPHELHDLSGDERWADTVQMWRERLIDILSERPDSLADGEKLIPQEEDWGPHSQGLEQ